MSISSAPCSTAHATSSSRDSSGPRPDGNAPPTLATWMSVSTSASTATGTISGYTHTAATGGTVGSKRSGRRALAHSDRTLPGVSLPSSVVRSQIRIRRSRAAAFVSFLIERVASIAARSSSPTASTATTRSVSQPEGEFHRATQSLQFGRRLRSGRVVVVEVVDDDLEVRLELGLGPAGPDDDA